MSGDKAKQSSAKKTTTVRDRIKSSKNSEPKKRRLSQTAKHISKPLKSIKRVGQKEVYLPMPDNKVGGFLNKKRRITPKFFVEAWQELKLVTWPNRKETMKLTAAVLIFAFVFGVVIAIVDYGLDKVFKELLLK